MQVFRYVINVCLPLFKILDLLTLRCLFNDNLFCEYIVCMVESENINTCR